MRKRLNSILAVLVVGAVLTGCGSTSAYAASAGSKTALSEADTSALTAEVQEEEISIRLSDKGSSASDDSVSISGSTVTITQEGTYRISGKLSDGQIGRARIFKGINNFFPFTFRFSL